MRPSALAVLKLMTSLIVVGDCTGRSGAIDIAGRTTILVEIVRPVRDQAAIGGFVTVREIAGSFSRAANAIIRSE